MMWDLTSSRYFIYWALICSKFKGYLDILLTLKHVDSNGATSYELLAFKNEYFDDVYFIKVMGMSPWMRIN